MTGQNGTITQTKSDISVTTSGVQPPSAAAVFLQFSPNPVNFGSTYTASWTSSNVSALTLSWTGPDGGNPGMSIAVPSGSVTNPTGPVGTYNFTLVGTGVDGTATDTETFIVQAGGSPPGPTPTASMVFSPNPVTYGSNYTASWTSSNVTSLTLSWTGPDGGNPGMSVAVPSGSVTNPTGPVGTYNFTLTGTGPYGTIVDTETFTVQSAAPPSFTESVNADITNPSILGTYPLTAGDTLRWRIRYATSSDAGTSGLASWTLVRDGTTTVASGNATLNHINGTLSPLIERTLSTAGNYTLSITMVGQGGTITRTISTITVSGSSLTPTASMTFTPNPVTFGSTYTASWTSANVTSLTLSWTGPDGGNPGMSVSVPSGSVTNPTGPAGTYYFTLVGNGPNGSVTDTETFVVQAGSPPSFTESVNADVSNITAGPGINLSTGDTLNWRIRYATSSNAGTSGLASWTLVRNGTTTVASGSATLNHVNGTLSAQINNQLFQAGQYTISITMAGQGGTITRTKSDINVT
jgi:hypothetical protein